MNQMRHPNLVPVYVSGNLGKLCYFEMELLKSDLASVIYNREKHSLPADQLLTFSMNMTSATMYLHYKKVCHRDIKPQNIFIAEGQAKLGDFGVATYWSKCNDIAGTFEYLPFDVQNGIVDMAPRCDVWGVGCVLHLGCQFMN